jgi:oxygen-dependent protoporphyrinogen oxidase
MMNEPTSPHPRRIVVIGGGITGLAAAHRCLELARERAEPLELLLLEGSGHLGGVIRTKRRGGFLLEGGPDSFITDKPWALDLCRRLGLEDRLIGTGPTHRRSFVVRGGRLLPVPEGFQLLAPSRLGPFITTPIFSWPGKLRMALDWVLPPRREEGDESLAGFVQRRLGREALDRMAQPMIAGIYGADPQRLSLQATMPRFVEMERQHGSVIRAMMVRRKGMRDEGRRTRDELVKGPSSSLIPHPSSLTGVSGARYGLFVSFRDGMQTLVDALVERLPAETARSSTDVRGLSPQAERRWRIELTGSNGESAGEVMEADAVCLALPAPRAAALVEPFDPELAASLAGIPYTSAMTMNLAYRRADIPHPLDGFGFVVPAIERRAILGCTFSSVKFPGRAPDDHALLRAFLAGSSLLDQDDAAIEAAVRADLRDLLGITTTPLFTTSSRHTQSMAQYNVGHLDRISAIESRLTRHAGLALAGNAYRGIGIPDCIRSGEQAAERLLA